MSEKIIEKIQKLLRLSRDKAATEAEALLAIEKANELLAEHNLSMLDLQDKEAYIVEGRSGYAYPWVKQLYNLVGKVNFCSYFCKAEHGNYQKVEHTYIGTKTNIAVSFEMSQYLVKTVLKNARKSPAPAAFSYGMADAIGKRLIDIYSEATKPNKDAQGSAGDNRSLVLASVYEQSEAEAEKVLESMGIQLETRKPRSRQVNAAGYRAGWVEGQSVNLKFNNALRG